jgi:ceramide glucosyltransferase
MHLPKIFAIIHWLEFLNNNLQWLFLLLCIGAIIYYLYALQSARVFFRPPTSIHFDYTPAISILKPVHGLDCLLYHNLASFCQQDYPHYQVIFGVQDPQDSSITVIHQLIQDFPLIDIQLVVNQNISGANRKVSNLNNALANADYEVLVLADSDIWVEPNYLRRIVQPLKDPTVAIVTCPYRSVAQNWLAAFEGLSLSTDFFPGVLVAQHLEGMTFALGATIVLRRQALDAIGGFKAIIDYLSDDFQIGYLAAQMGYRVVLSNCIVDHTMATTSLQQFIQHQLRWNRGVRVMRPWGYVGLIFTYGIVNSLILLALTRGSLLSWIILGITWILRLWMAQIIGIRHLRDPVAQQYFWWIPMRDCVHFLLWIYSFLGNQVTWHGYDYHLLRGGKIKPLQTTTLIRQSPAPAKT